MNYNRSQRTNPVYPRPEIKYLTVAYTSTALVQAGNTTGLNANIVQGTAAGNRVGQQIAQKSVYWQYILTLGTTPTPACCRIMLVWDKQSNGNAAAGITDVLEVVAGTPPVPLPIYAPMNMANRDRFVVLSDERYDLSPNGQQIRIIDGFRSINQRVTYPMAGGAAAPDTGALILLTMSDVDSDMKIAGTWRLKWIDN